MHIKTGNVALCLFLLPACADNLEPTLAAALPETFCAFNVTGTSNPNTSGIPTVINQSTGTVISANFFNSGAIDPPHFDGLEFVSVCVKKPDNKGNTAATISTDVGRDDDTQIKGYPQFIVGTKFGNLYETSFRYYPNTGLPLNHQWPVRVANPNKVNEFFEFANLEYVSQVKGIELPAFTNNLPDITITLDMDETNVMGAERDVMIESWFYDTTANADLLDNNIATGQPFVGTLNNIVGVGHAHYPELDNTLLEMMVHVGPLSPNDVSGATRNPGQNQLTENYSGRDSDGDGIDDHFDVDSHVNRNNNMPPQPGIYSSGIDNNQDGIDDADVLPVQIGSHEYSIWYGESYLSPIVIYSRETNTSLTNDFDPAIPDIDLSTEGQLTLPWNDFINFTLHNLEPMLQAAQFSNAAWATGPDNPFPKMSAPGGAISGVEFGVEPQINDSADQAYSAIIRKLDINVNGRNLGLSDVTKPEIAAFSYAETSDTPPLLIFEGTAADNVAVDRVEITVKNSSGQYWNGSDFQSTFTRILTDGTSNWSKTLALPDGTYLAQPVAFDTSNNWGTTNAVNFAVAENDNIIPTIQISAPSTGTTTSTVEFSGIAQDNVALERVAITLVNATGQYWNGTAFQDTFARIPMDGTSTWSKTLSLPDGLYTAQPVAFDTSNNWGATSPVTFTVMQVDNTKPTIILKELVTGTDTSAIEINGTAQDNVALDRVALTLVNTEGKYWNGSAFQNSYTRITMDGTSSWSKTIALPDGLYTAQPVAFDTSNNWGATSSVTFTVGVADNTKPTVVLSEPATGTTTSPVVFKGTAQDNVSLERVAITLVNTAGQYWNGSTFQSTFTRIVMDGTSNWSKTIALPNGTYTVQPVAFDNFNNWQASSATIFSIAD